MSRVILTTCGTSLSESSCWTADDSDLRPVSSILERNISEKEKMKADWANWIDRNRDNLVDKFNRECWDNNLLIDLPAELASLRVMQLFCEKNNIPLNVNDKLILLYADNADAEYCAKVINKVLTNNNLLNDVSIEPLWKVDGLNPADISNFKKSIEKLWSELIIRMPWQTGESNIKYYLNLTGGYKSTVMLLSCFAYFKGISDTYIFYLNEESGMEVLIIGFDPEQASEQGLSSLKTGYILSDSGDLISESITLQDLS